MKKIVSFFVCMIFAISLSACRDSGKIAVISREDGSGTRDVFSDFFGLKEKFSDGRVEDETTADSIIANKAGVTLVNVENDEDSIGYVSISSLNSNVSALSIDGVSPTEENVRNGLYRLVRQFSIVAKGRMSAVASDFVDFVLSKQGQHIVDIDYISQNYDSVNYTQDPGSSGKISISGSSSVSPLVEKLAEEYKKINPSVDIEIQESDSTSGISDVSAGRCQIGMSSRKLSAEEEDFGLREIPIALDALAVVVNKKSQICNASKEEISAVYRGAITRWSQFSR
jgi:phosphate transport system substrate-binding protein